MTFPPSFVRLDHGRHSYWIPIFLLWPLLLFAWLLAGVFAAIALLIFSPGGLPLAIDFCGALARLFCGLRGTRIAIQANHADFDFTVY
jgi:hypothetical protein